ncbi:hypothetical protein [Cellulophaga sp. Z1A5H]|uniref:hypothetical protein n=1 Tax=Cellulophaga sp. Z1A5H TaxID=2687291 RepID=UPI0013FE3417|nr:hypothetical protein [Cellulophaga sp. Z1A5H]
MKIKSIKYILIAPCILLLYISGKERSSYTPQDVEIKKTWNSFLKAVEKKERRTFKGLSKTKIRCYPCLENTTEEQAYIAQLQETDTLWYDTIYEDLIYVPIDRFIAQDFDLFFNPDFVKLLKERETIFYKQDLDGVFYWEILVTTTEPTLFHEGGQHHFRFEKCDDGWKLNEIGTIP